MIPCDRSVILISLQTVTNIYFSCYSTFMVPSIQVAAYILKILFCAEMAVRPSKDQPCLARSRSGLSLLESGRKLFLQSETAKHLLLNTVISQSSCFKKQVTKESESQILSFTLAIGKDMQLSFWWHTYVSMKCRVTKWFLAHSHEMRRS